MNKKYRYSGESLADRPAIVAVIGMSIGVIAGVQFVYLSDYVSLFLILPVLALFILTLISKTRFGTYLFLFLLFVCLGLALSDKPSEKSLSGQSVINKTVIHATVARIVSNNRHHRIILLRSGVMVQGQVSLRGYGRLSLRDNSTLLAPGDRISFRSSIKHPVNRGNPGEYDWEADCQSEGISWLVSAGGQGTVTVLNSSFSLYPMVLVSDLRHAMSEFIENKSCDVFSVKEAASVKAIHKGIILGDRAEIDSQLNNAFAVSGLIHMLSASGSHVTIVGAMTFALVKIGSRLWPNILLWAPLQKMVAICCIPIITIYCMLVGFKPPAMRAGMFGVILALSIISERKWDSINTLAVAGLGILIFFPMSIFTPSFQLSFSAVTGILLALRSPAYARLMSFSKNPKVEHFDVHKNLRKATQRFDFIVRPIVALFVCSMAATVAIVPLTLHYFHRVPLYTLPANLAADLPLTLGLSLGLLSALIGSLFPFVGGILLIPADLFVWLVIKIAVFVNELPFSSLQLPNIGFTGLLISSAATATTFYYLLRPRKNCVLIVASSWCIFLASLFFGQTIQNHTQILRVVFLNVGNGDAAYVRPPGANGFLIDAGVKTPHFDCGQSIISPFLLWEGVSGLDAIMISHPDSDHIGGTSAVISNFTTRNLFLNYPHKSNRLVQELVALAKKEGIEVHSSTSETGSFSIGEVFINFLHPKDLSGKYRSRKTNDQSVVTRIVYKKFSVIFTGDLEKHGEQELMESQAKLASTILKVPHHGGKTGAVSTEILSRISPRIAVISADYPAQRGLAAPEVIAKIEELGAHVFWTGRDGAITIRTDGAEFIEVIAGKTKQKILFSDIFRKNPIDSTLSSADKLN